MAWGFSAGTKAPAANSTYPLLFHSQQICHFNSISCARMSSSILLVSRFRCDRTHRIRFASLYGTLACHSPLYAASTSPDGAYPEHREGVGHNAVKDASNSSEADEEPTVAAQEEPVVGHTKQKQEPVDVSRIRSNADRTASGDSRVPRTIGVDYGTRRTGTAVSYMGLAPRPSGVLTSHGVKLASELLEIARLEEADEFVVGLPVFARGQESEQAKKVRAFASLLAKHAAERGWRVYLQTEFNSSRDALEYMIATGSNQRSRRKQLDAYAAMIILQQYFEDDGCNAQLLLPKNRRLQMQIIEGPSRSHQALGSPAGDDDDLFVDLNQASNF